ncbi:hypothetical protein Tco_1172234 [Tanacetum coccineum]
MVLLLVTTVISFLLVGFMVPAGRLFGFLAGCLWFSSLALVSDIVCVLLLVIGPQTPLDLRWTYCVYAYGLVYLFYGSAGGHVITAARGRRFGSSYDDKSWFGKGYIYRNCILPIFLAGLSLSTCKHIHLFWSHSVPPGAYTVPTGLATVL